MASKIKISAQFKSIIARDHGKDAVVTRSFLDEFAGWRHFEVNGVVWGYDDGGTLIDSYRYTVGRTPHDAIHRKEIDRRGMALQPLALSYEACGADIFPAMVKLGGQQISTPDIITSYVVLHDDGTLGVVAKVRYPAESCTYQPVIQWLAVSADGTFWSGYGDSREEAGRYLLGFARTPTKLAKAA